VIAVPLEVSEEDFLYKNPLTVFRYTIHAPSGEYDHGKEATLVIAVPLEVSEEDFLYKNQSKSFR